ncbi:MAG: MFS transporter [Desulfobacterales bacterium]|jgi:MFS family permease
MISPQKVPSPPLRLAWLVWGIGALFYLMAFFQRVAPAVMTDALMREFQIGAAALGNLSALYFYSYVAMQIPTGIIADLWGPRRLMSVGALVAGVGTLLFALAPGMLLVGLGRLLIGGSVAVAFVGLLQLANNWLPPRFYALAAGMALLVGIVGAVGAGPPLRLLLDLYGWRATIMVSGLVTFAIAAAIWLQVRDHPHDRGFADWRPTGNQATPAQRLSVLAGLGKVIRYQNTALLFLIPGGLVGPVLTFSGLWGVPFFTTHHGLSPARASVFTTTLLVAWALGGPLFGWLSDHFGRRKPLYMAGSVMALAGWVVVVYAGQLPRAALLAMLVIVGLGSGCMIISFAFVKESVPATLTGTATGLINMGVMTGPMLLQPLVGWMLDLGWSGQTMDGIRVYGLAAYRAGFNLMLAWTAMALLLLCFTRETHCRPLEEN